MPDRSRHRIVRSVRRSTQWLGSAVETGPSTLAAASVVLDQTFAFGEPATIIRTRGQLYIRSDQGAATEEPFGAMGIAVVTNEAAAAGVASVPTPMTEKASDSWFVWQPFLADVFFSDATGTRNAFRIFEFDSKAMRKVHDGNTGVLVLENANASDGLNYMVSFRMLVKLHG